ncbi:MAG: hypothetical protein GY861_07165 [bacterium]|nr:hypothetical protein [bacterium]
MKWLKRFFSKEEEPTQESVALEDMDKWLESNAKSAIEEFNIKLKESFQNIEMTREKLLAALEKLENATLHNDKIDIRSKNAMEGNRNAYCQRIKQFSESLKAPQDINATTAREFCENIGSLLTAMTKNTAKNFFILQEFFRNEALDIAKPLKEIDFSVKNMKKFIDASKTGRISEAQEKTAGLKRAIQQKEEFTTGVQTKEKETKDLQESLKEKKKQREATEKDNALLKLINDKEVASKQLSEKEAELFHYFAVIEAALKKYKRMSLDEALIESYTASPLAALEKDSELKICSLLQNLTDMITKKEIELKDKKREKIIQTIGLLNREYFEGFLKEYQTLKDKNSELKTAVTVNPATIKLSQLKHSIKSEEETLSSTEKELEKLKHDLNKINLDKLKSELEKKIKEAGFSVVIITQQKVS